MDNVIKTAVADIALELGVPESVVFTVEHPTELSHGDYACNIALVSAKVLGQAPREIAEQFRAALDGVIEYIDRIEIAGPGFLNFYLARDFYASELARAIALGDDWGKGDAWADKRVVVEYTDPNPFKEFHIGHLFTNAVGESIARLFMMNGADVKRVCYQGDVGLHVAHAIYGMQQLGMSATSDFTPKDLGKAYAFGANAYKEDEAAQSIIRDINKKVYSREDDAINALYDAGRKVSLEYFGYIYNLVDTQFDEFFFESEAGPKGKELVLANPTIFPESDSARVFKGEDYGLHTRVFLNKEGLPTYEAKELALAKLKEDRLGAYDLSVISTAKEITEYFKVLLQAMSFVYPALADKTEHIGHGMVRLTTGKMSSRTGDVIGALEFITDVAQLAESKILEFRPELAEDAPRLKDESADIAVAAIKYATLKAAINQDSVFDKDKALSFEGDSGPYLQYTHARITSVLEKAAAAGVVPALDTTPPAVYEVEQLVYRFPEVIASALQDRAPHQVATYITQLAGAFNTFYATEKIADAADAHAPYKAAVAAAVQQTIKNGLWVLGIKAPERM